MKDANEFNEPAPKGQEYVAVRIRIRYIGTEEPDTLQLVDSSYLNITGEKNVVYQRQSVVPPSPALQAYLFSGGETEGYDVLTVAKGEKGLRLIFGPPFSFDGDETRFLALE